MEPTPHNTKNAATSAANADDGQSQFEAQDTIHHSTDCHGQQRAAANPAYETAVMLAREYRLRVYPVHGWHDGRCTCERGAQCDNGGKHPILKNWPKLATTDLAQIARWNEEHPRANWGVLADEITIFEADGIPPVDGKPGTSPRECIPDQLYETAGFVIKSGGGSLHVAHANPASGPKPKNWVRVMPGADTRGVGGGSILPGSVSYKGAYTWEREPGPQPFTPFPTPLAHQLKRNQDRNREHIRKVVKGDGPIPQGTRDTAMFQTVADLWNGGMEPDELLQVALEINRTRCKPPLPEATIRDKVKRRIAQPRRPRASATLEDVSRYVEPQFISEMIRFTISGYARRVAVNYADQLCYVAQWGWCYYRDGQWLRDVGDLEAAHLVKQTINLSAAWAALPEQEERWGTEKGRAQWFRGTTFAHNNVPQIVHNARSEPELRARAEEFDADPWLLNTPECVLDLKHPGKTYPHGPDQRHAKQTGAHHNPKAECPQWLRYLDSTFRGDQDLIAYLQMVLGYMLTGDCSEQVWFLLVGRKGRNGKGVLTDTLHAVLGSYAQGLDINVLLAKGQNRDGNAPKPALAALVNVRISTSQEPDGGLSENAKWDVATIKEWTGEDWIQLRDLYGKCYKFKPMVKLLVSVNVVPQMKEHTAAVWDRIIPIPFLVYFERGQRDTGLRDKLKAEASGILNWMLEGLWRWLELRARGKTLSDEDVLPEAVRVEKHGEQERDDEYAGFFNNVLVHDSDPAAHVKLADAWDAWKTWREKMAAVDKVCVPHALPDARALAALAEKRGYPKRRGHGGATYLWNCCLHDPSLGTPHRSGDDQGEDGEGSKSKTENSPIEKPVYREFPQNQLGASPSSPNTKLLSACADLRAAVDDLLARADVPVALDIETNGLCPETNQIVAIQLHQEGRSVYIVDWRRSDFTWQAELMRLLRGVKILGHNLNFDIAMLIGREGITRRDVTVAHDTMLAERVIHGNRSKVHTETGDDVHKGYSLEAVAGTYGISLDKTEQKGWEIYTPGSSAWSTPFTPAQLTYAARDVEVLPAIVAKQRERLEAVDQQAVADLEHRILPVLADFRAFGTYVDRGLWSAIAADDVPRVTRAAEKARALLGNAEINLNSPAQLIPALGKVGVEVGDTRKETLHKVRHMSPAVEAILEYRALAKAESSYSTKWLEAYVRPSGRVHPDWKQIGTETGRMSCSDPSLPQLPKDQHREAIVASAGNMFLIADFSNAELRIAAANSGDEAMISAFHEGRDLHSDTARAIFGLAPDVDVRAADSFGPGQSYRDVAKTVNFALLYGTTPFGLANDLGLDPHLEDDLARAKAVMDSHRKTYPRLWKWLDTNKHLATERGYAVTPLGRRRYFDVPPKPEYWIEDRAEYWRTYGKPLADMHREAANHPIQGGCADIFKMTIALLNEDVDANAMHITVYVYDELVVEVPDEHLDHVEAALKRAIVQAGEWAEVPIPEPEVMRSHHWCKA